MDPPEISFKDPEEEHGRGENTHRDDRLLERGILTDHCRVGVLAEHRGIVIDIGYINAHSCNIT